MSKLYERFSQLSKEKQILLMSRLNQKGVKKNTKPELIPLSFSQESIWVAEKLFPNKSLNNIAGVCVFRGKFDIDIFYNAASVVIERHEIFKTVFVIENEKPYQKFLNKKRTLNKTFFDLENISEKLKESEAKKYILTEGKKPFNLSEDLLIRFSILRFSETEHHILGCMHHIVSDGWSTGILLNEIFSVYQNMVRGIEHNFQSLSIQYQDYCLSDRQEVDKENREEKLTYWVETLHDLPAEITLPTDRIKPAISSCCGGRVPFEIPSDFFKKLKKFSRDEGVTPFMFLLGIYAVVLYRYSHQEVFAVGVPQTGRHSKELEGLIGCFVDLLAFRIDLSGEPSFLVFLHRIKNIVLHGIDQGGIPFESILKALNTERQATGSPVFQVSFSYEHEPHIVLSQDSDILIDFHEVSLEIVRYDFSLELMWSKEKETLQGWFDFNKDIFDQLTVERIADSFVNTLTDALKNPLKLISQLDILSAYQKNTLLYDWNRTLTEYTKNSTIHNIFSEQAKLTPHAIALSSELIQISYAELDDLSSHFAATLLKNKITTGCSIALCIDRSIEAIISMLAILKVGCAYVPISIEEPEIRRTQMLLDGDVNLVLILRSDLNKFQHIKNIEIIVYENVAENVHHNIFIDSEMTKTNLASIMFTSGSTGNPKGVMVTHKNIIRLVKQSNYADFGPDEVGVLLAPLAFDASTFEIWGQLLNGGKLIIAPKGILSLHEIAGLIQKNNVTTLWLTAGLFHAMVDEELDNLSRVRQLLAGGDVLSRTHVKRFLQAAPNCRLINGYGPTETTTFACCHLISIDDFKYKSIPIGKPVSNTTVYILDKYLQPVPVGVYGDIYIGGDGVALGYSKNPILTSEKFISDPFCQELSQKLYHSGDRGRYLENGLIEFQCRDDDQIKLRGYRIESGEIEAAIMTHPYVKKAVIIVINHEITGKQLCAYVTYQKNFNDSSINWTIFLKDLLPTYMIPSLFVKVEEIPLTKNGKTDLRQLPKVMFKAGGSDQKPQSDIEIIFASIWCELFQIDQCGRFDNFFELGGDSIHVVRFVSRALNKGIYIEAKDVFTCQTLNLLAEVAEAKQNNELQSNLSGPIALTPIQRWFFNLECKNYSHWNQWIMIKLPKAFSFDLLRLAFITVTENYDAFKLRFQKTDAQWQQTLTDEANTFIEHVNFATIPKEAIQDALYKKLNELHLSLNISNGPLSTAAFIEQPNMDYNTFIIVAHHLVIDQFSWYLFLEALNFSIENLKNINSEISKQYSPGFAKWANYAATLYKPDELIKATEKWKYHAWNKVGKFPVDFNFGSNLEKDNKKILIEYDKNLSKNLKSILEKFNLKLDDLLLIFLTKALSIFTESSYVKIDRESNGRYFESSHINVSQTIGWFTNLYPVLIDSSEKDLVNYIKEAKEQIRIFENMGSIYQLLDLKIPNSAVVFNFLGEVDQRNLDTIDYGFSQNNLVIARDPEATRTHFIIVTARVASGQLQISWEYSQKLHNEESIKKLSDYFTDCIKEMIISPLKINQYHRTCSDFPDSGLKNNQLQTLLSTKKYFGQAGLIEDIYPLSPLQESLLFQALIEPYSDAYFVQFIGHLEGELNIDAFKNAWQLVIKKYAVLRTHFEYENLDSPIQIVKNNCALPFKFFDCADKTEDDQKALFDEIVKSDRSHKFDLCSDTLFRLCLMKSSANNWKLLWSFHHIILDGWSMAIVLRDVFLFYNSIIKNDSKLFKQEISFKKFILSQNSRKKESLAEWKKYLSGFNFQTYFPTFKNTQSAHARLCNESFFDADSTNSLYEFSRSHQLTLATILQGAWALIISQFSNAREVVFGTTVSGRISNVVDVESIVGLLINTVPQRIIINSECMLKNWLLEIQSNFVKMGDHVHVGLGDIKNTCGFKSNASIFESILVIENYPVDDNPLKYNSKLFMKNFYVIEQVHFPIAIVVYPEKKLHFKIYFDSGRFSEKFIEYISEMLRYFISNISGNAQKSIKSICHEFPKADFNERNFKLKEKNISEDISQSFFSESIDLEKKLVAIWSELLGIDTCALDDDFYDLGGHSLLILKMCSRINQQLQKSISVADLLPYSTIRSLSLFLLSQGKEKNSHNEIEIRAKMRKSHSANRKNCLN